MAQTLRDSDPLIYDIIHCIPRYTLDMKKYHSSPLFLSNKIENFDYRGSVICRVIIDSLEKSITKVGIMRIDVYNERDTISLTIINSLQIDEYSGEQSELVNKMYPFIKNYVLDKKLIRDEKASPSPLIRFYDMCFKIKVL
jgi:hypothetical protein